MATYPARTEISDTYPNPSNAVARLGFGRLWDWVREVLGLWIVAGGTANAITATYSPAFTTLVDGQTCKVRAIAANSTTTPTFSPNGLTARTITMLGGSALAIGSIAGAGHELTLKYNLTDTRWELLNPSHTAGAVSLVNDQTWSGSQRGTVVTDNDGSFDMAAANNFICTPTAGFTLTFTNITAGQSGNIYLVNGANYQIAKAASTLVTNSLLAAISTTGEYWLSYYSPDGTNVLVTHAGDFA